MTGKSSLVMPRTAIKKTVSFTLTRLNGDRDRKRLYGSASHTSASWTFRTSRADDGDGGDTICSPLMRPTCSQWTILGAMIISGFISYRSLRVPSWQAAEFECLQQKIIIYYRLQYAPVKIMTAVKVKIVIPMCYATLTTTKRRMPKSGTSRNILPAPVLSYKMQTVWILIESDDLRSGEDDFVSNCLQGTIPVPTWP